MTASPPPVPTAIPSDGPIAIVGPLSIMQILDRTFRVMRARIGTLALSASMIFVPIGILSTLFMGRFMTNYFEFLGVALEPGAQPPDMGEFATGMVGYMAAIFGFSIVSFVGTSMVMLMSIFHVEQFLHGKESTIGDGWRASLGRLLPYLGQQIVQGLIIGAITAGVLLVVGLVFGLLAVVFGGAMSAIGNDAAGIMMGIGFILIVLVGYILFFIIIFLPTLYFSGRWVGSVPALLIEKLGPVESLRRSWRLTASRRWRSVLFMFLMFIFGMIVIGIPVGIVQMILTFAMPTQLALVSIVTTIISYAVNLFYQPFYAAGTVLYYYDARVREEAYDVTLRLEALEAEIAPDAPVL